MGVPLVKLAKGRRREGLLGREMSIGKASGVNYSSGVA